MPYPARPVLPVLPQFIGTAGVRQTPEQRQQLLEFVASEYAAGRSLRLLCTCQWPTWKLVHRARVERPTTQVTGLRYLVSNE